MKKIFLFILLIVLLNNYLWNQENPDQTMEKLINLFKQYIVTTIPDKISAKEFNEKIIDKIAKEDKKNFILSIYTKDTSGNFYIVKDNLNEDERKKAINILHVIDYRILTDEQKNENKKTSDEIEKIFNYRALIVGSLIDHWDNMTKEQQNDFYTSFKGVIEVIAYPQGGYFYTNSKNTFKKSIFNGDRAVIASQNYNIDKDIDISISYIFKKNNNNWTLVDVEMNDHSLIDAYRLQINRIVQKKGVAGLLADLKKMYNEMKAK